MEGLPSSEIENKEVRHLSVELDEAIAAAAAGETNQAIDKLSDVVTGVDKDIECDMESEVAVVLWRPGTTRAAWIPTLSSPGSSVRPGLSL